MSMIKRSELARQFGLKTWREFPPMNTSLGTMLHNQTGSWRYLKPIYEDKTPPCRNTCPAGNDIEGWIKILQKGDFKQAYWHLKREQPFPAVLGRVCFTFCEPACNRLQLDEAVGIRDLERFLGDQVPLSTPHPDLPQGNGKGLAVVGSGPAGMSAAYYGRLLGYEVHLFEALPVLGGILRVGIPAYRLPRELVEAEFEGLKNMGIVLKPNTPIGDIEALAELRNAFDYIFLATGVHQSMKLLVKGEDEGKGVLSGLALLKKIAQGEPVHLGKKTTVVGGGNTAIDCARTAVRMGCDVTVLYRRSEAEMPAHPEEIREAREEGVQFHFLAAPERVELNEDGFITKLVCSEMRLGPPDESGRRRPEKKEGALFDITTDTVVTAIGERPDFSYLKDAVPTENGVLHPDENLQVHASLNGKAKIYAGGDIIDMPHTVVHAVAASKKAVIAMDCDLKGKDVSEIMKSIAVGNGSAVSFSKYMNWKPVNPVSQNLREVVDSEKIVYDYFQKVPRTTRKNPDADARKRSFEAYAITFSDDEAREEGARCLHCGRCTECDNCLIFCPDMSVLCRGTDRFGYAFDYDYCKGCGICFTECPRHAISMVEEETPVPEEG